MRKVLIVTYYWPPAGGSGVQRVLKYAKYLPEFGWQPLVLTVRHGAYPALDPTLMDDVPASAAVQRTFSLEPTALYKRFVGIPVEAPAPGGVLAEREIPPRKRIANWVRMNLFVPDAKIGWIPWAVREGGRMVSEHRPELLFSSSPPPTVHLIAGALARRHHLPWVADFRDPWTDIHYYEGQRRLAPSRWLDRRLEARTFAEAAQLTFASSLDARFYGERYGPSDRFTAIPNGFDDDDYAAVGPAAAKSDAFTLLHIGSIAPNQFPGGLLDALAAMLDSRALDARAFRLRLVGALPEAVISRFRAHRASVLIDFGAYVPHREAVAMAQAADALLLLVPDTGEGRRVLPGKTLEYLRHSRPILALGPGDGEVARVLQEVGAGATLEHGDVIGIRQRLQGLVEDRRRGIPGPVAAEDAIRGYSRRSLTGRLVRVFDAALDLFGQEKHGSARGKNGAQSNQD